MGFIHCTVALRHFPGACRCLARFTYGGSVRTRGGRLYARYGFFEVADVAPQLRCAHPRPLFLHLPPEGEACSLVHDLPHLGGIVTGLPNFAHQDRVVFVCHIGRLRPDWRSSPQHSGWRQQAPTRSPRSAPAPGRRTLELLLRTNVPRRRLDACRAATGAAGRTSSEEFPNFFKSSNCLIWLQNSLRETRVKLGMGELKDDCHPGVFARRNGRVDTQSCLCGIPDLAGTAD